MSTTDEVLVIGAGVAGLEASLLLASAGRKCYLVEKTSVIGGMLIKCEDVFANMECATCMIAPRQQAVLQNDLIEVLTLSEVTGLEGSTGSFHAHVRQKASFVDPVACIGCAACFEACIDNQDVFSCLVLAQDIAISLINTEN